MPAGPFHCRDRQFSSVQIPAAEISGKFLQRYFTVFRSSAPITPTKNNLKKLHLLHGLLRVKSRRHGVMVLEVPLFL